MTPEQLKSSILQYAIQGKLVEQRAEEGTAEDLYLKIKEEKETLIKNGKAKKGKTLSHIEDEEKPFDIPESWKWVYLQDIANINGGYAFKSTDYASDGTRVIRISDFNENGFVNTKIVRHPYKEEFEPFLLVEKDILLCMTGGTVGKSFFVQNVEEQMMTNQRVATIKILGSIQEYVNYVILSPITQNAIRASKTSTNDNISMDTINSFLIPLPPFDEVRRIVVKIEELLSFVDRYAEAYEKLEKFNARFPEDMKKSILQYAIMGKLVEQRAEEGTAEELYQQIQKEKQKLIDEKKIKKEKSLAEITEDEIPFDIPESWKWVRVGGLFSHNTGKAMNASAKKVDKPGAIRKFITTSNVYWNTLDLQSVKEMFFSDDELERCTITKGDLLMCEGGAYYGRTAIWNYDYDICFQNHVHRLRSYLNLDLLYFYYVFYFYRNTGMMQSKGTAMPGLSSIVLHEMIVPLPPLEEQRRIVAKIEELLPYCDRLIK